MKSQLNEGYYFGFEYNRHTWETWMKTRKHLLEHVEEHKNDNIYRQTTNYHVIRHLENNANPYELINLLFNLNMNYADKLKELISLSPPPNVILARTPEDYDKIVKELKDEKNQG